MQLLFYAVLQREVGGGQPDWPDQALRESEQGPVGQAAGRQRHHPRVQRHGRASAGLVAGR